MKIEKIMGPEDIKRLFEETLKSKEKSIRTVLTDKPVVYLAGNEYADHYIAQRAKLGISVKSLRVHGQESKTEKERPNCSVNKQVRIAPEEFAVEYSIVICDDFVAIIDVKDATGTLVRDNNNAATMKNWFDYVWHRSG